MLLFIAFCMNVFSFLVFANIFLSSCFWNSQNDIVPYKRVMCAKPGNENTSDICHTWQYCIVYIKQFFKWTDRTKTFCNHSTWWNRFDQESINFNQFNQKLGNFHGWSYTLPNWWLRFFPFSKAWPFPLTLGSHWALGHGKALVPPFGLGKGPWLGKTKEIGRNFHELAGTLKHNQTGHWLNLDRNQNCFGHGGNLPENLVGTFSKLIWWQGPNGPNS